MINSSRSYNIDDYMEILQRRIWYLIIPFLLVMVGTVLYAKFTPRIYKASTLIAVTPQKVPESFVHPTVTSGIEERLHSIAQEVTSRTRLEQVINEFRLYHDESNTRTLEEVVEFMRKNIIVELPTKRNEKGYFSIGFMGKDPNTVTTVANRLASLFIEENLKMREQQAVGTTEFLTTELAAKKAKLEELEAAVSQYKSKHMGELPEQRDANLRILEQTQNQYQRVGENMRAAQDRKLFLQKQLSELESGTALSDPGIMGRDKGLPLPSESEITLKKNLDDLRARYTENHPDVKAIKKKLADLETKKDIYTIRSDPRYRELKNQLSINDGYIKRLQREEEIVGSQINRYRGRIESVPAREQEMASLFREYQNMKESYETLLRKSQDAQQAENLERRQKGEQFRVIDPARVPETPFSPNIPKVLLIGLVISIGCSFGAALIREQLDRSFHDAGDVEVTLGLRVLATIPKIEEIVT